MSISLRRLNSDVREHVTEPHLSTGTSANGATGTDAISRRLREVAKIRERTMSAEYYRKQARLCRKRAYEAPLRELATKWLAMADEYEQLALSLEQTGAAPRTVH